jgi:hypothetical protein
MSISIPENRCRYFNPDMNMQCVKHAGHIGQHRVGGKRTKKADKMPPEHNQQIARMTELAAQNLPLFPARRRPRDIE